MKTERTGLEIRRLLGNAAKDNSEKPIPLYTSFEVYHAKRFLLERAKGEIYILNPFYNKDQFGYMRDLLAGKRATAICIGNMDEKDILALCSDNFSGLDLSYLPDELWGEYRKRGFENPGELCPCLITPPSGALYNLRRVMHTNPNAPTTYKDIKHEELQDGMGVVFGDTSQFEDTFRKLRRIATPVMGRASPQVRQLS